MAENVQMEKLVALCKRRGFIFQSSEIYGGINGFWDYGPLGVELKRNIKNAWWEDVVRKRDDIVGLDCSIIMNPKVWEASGHLGGFSDPMVDCKESKKRYRADQLLVIYAWDVSPGEEGNSRAEYHFAFVENDQDSYDGAIRKIRKQAKRLGVNPVSNPPVLPFMSGEFQGREELIVGPDTNTPGTLTEPKAFNLMFKSYAGASEDSSSEVYLRPETAQGIFCNWKNVLDTSRMKLPFGIAQIGKAFRNEINPRNFTFRSREFEQMETQFFCRESEAPEWFVHWRDARFQWYIDHGLQSARLRLRNHETDELAHYAKVATDIEYHFPFGISELEGIHNRADFDLLQHQKYAGKDMTYYDDQTKERFIPHVVEFSGGVDRATLAFLCEAYTEDEAPDEKGKMQSRTVMKLHPRLAPIKLAVFPLVKKDGMPEIAREIHQDARAAGLASFYDEKGAVGRRYRRQDEAGTPFCVTVDGQTLKDKTVTIRDRDTLHQDRISLQEVVSYVRERI